MTMSDIIFLWLKDGGFPPKMIPKIYISYKKPHLIAEFHKTGLDFLGHSRVEKAQF